METNTTQLNTNEFFSNFNNGSAIYDEKGLQLRWAETTDDHKKGGILSGSKKFIAEAGGIEGFTKAAKFSESLKAATQKAAPLMVNLDQARLEHLQNQARTVGLTPGNSTIAELEERIKNVIMAPVTPPKKTVPASRMKMRFVNPKEIQRLPGRQLSPQQQKQADKRHRINQVARASRQVNRRVGARG